MVTSLSVCLLQNTQHTQEQTAVKTECISICVSEPLQYYAKKDCITMVD